ncbi:lipid-A-disaccharide synthase [Oceanicella actignis]|nr:lipid-A-disaccharide synthase [Oceanicella actignis]
MSAAPLRIHLIAGEPSGDRLGAALMRALTRISARPVTFSGVGGPLMQAAGLRSLFPADELAVMGLAEVLPRLPRLLARIDQAARDVARARPDALVTIDSPSFSLRVARRARRAAPGLRTIHYVAPSVWAWRPGRAAKMARHTDHVLALLPFEPPYMQEAGMSCDFVGHPVVERGGPEDHDAAGLRARLGVGERPLLALLPGSRAGEVARLAAPFAAAAARLTAARPDLAVVVPMAEGVAAQVAEAARGWPFAAHLLDPRGRDPAEAEAEKFAALAAADLALAASGTVTLELAAMRTPHVIGYKANALTAALLRRLIRVDTGNLVNLLTGRKEIPEFFQEDCAPEALAGALAPLLSDGPARERQLAAADEALALLGRGGPPPSERAARSVLARIGAPMR